MILIGQYDSVRRVAIALRLYGLPFEHRPWFCFRGHQRKARAHRAAGMRTRVLAV
jgi:glutathione S-transferase